MDVFEDLKKQLRDALTHLYDHNYQPAQLLYTVSGCDPKGGVAPLQSVIIQGIQDLQPALDVPPGAYTKRAYDVLYHRYVLKLTLEETAELLNVSVRHLTRLQRDAVHTLARFLWERAPARESSVDGRIGRSGAQPQENEAPYAQAADWRSQMNRELASLETSAPGAMSGVEQAISDVVELEKALTLDGGVRVEKGFVQPDLFAAIHPSALRQMLITALSQLARHTSSELVTVSARLENGNVKLTLAGALTTGDRPSDSDLIDGILIPGSVSAKICLDGDRIFLWLELPFEGRSTVLVVDDNPDMARFYQRATEGTRYRIVHIALGREVFDAIETVAPDVIILDVMLPDVDGWRLLMHLRENPATRLIPVVVCSVVREEKLAMSLGAVLYLPKPVRPREFIQALDQVLR